MPAASITMRWTQPKTLYSAARICKIAYRNSGPENGIGLRWIASARALASDAGASALVGAWNSISMSEYFDRPLEHLAVVLEARRPQGFGFPHQGGDRLLQRIEVDRAVDQQTDLPLGPGVTHLLVMPDI